MRGRPPAQITRQRQQVIDALARLGQLPQRRGDLAALSREARMPNWRRTRDVIADLKKIDALNFLHLDCVGIGDN